MCRASQAGRPVQETSNRGRQGRRTVTAPVLHGEDRAEEPGGLGPGQQFSRPEVHPSNTPEPDSSGLVGI